MSNLSDRKRPASKDCTSPDSKKSSVQLQKNAIYDNVEYKANLKNKWGNDQPYSDENVSFDSHPFPYGELKNFLDAKFLKEFTEKMTTFEFHEKASDLFQFRQSEDLKSFVDPHIFQIMEHLTNHVQPLLKEITNLPLNSDIDLFLSDYRKNDFLLCHDDELDSRRIAFILYLSENWKAEFGGDLDLFSSTEQIHPAEVVKSLTPEFNKFVFFEVSAKSFHQVREILKDDVSRFALSGWFYGEAVPRPKIEFPQKEGYLYLDHKNDSQDIMKHLCSESYLSNETLHDINEQLTEESQVLIPGFLQDSIYKSICTDIVDQDITKSVFKKNEPPNVSCFVEAFQGPPSNLELKTNVFDFESLRLLFHSNEFLRFMETLTEFPFTSCPILKVNSSLKKFGKGSYSLLRSGGAKQTGETYKISDNEEDDNEEEPNLVDIHFFVASKWDENWGGLTIYSAEDGEQLITIPPEGNCLAVVVRNSSVNSYINYINSNGNDEVFFVYSMTCAFDGKL